MKGPFGFKALALVPMVTLLAACGGSQSPVVASTPTPLPAANLVTSGAGTWLLCAVNCVFQGDGRNLGSGCARDVRGVTRFYGASGEQLGSAFAWSLAATRTVRPNEAFVYLVTLVPTDINSRMRQYRSEVAWTNVAC